MHACATIAVGCLLAVWGRRVAVGGCGCAAAGRALVGAVGRGSQPGLEYGPRYLRQAETTQLTRQTPAPASNLAGQAADTDKPRATSQGHTSPSHSQPPCCTPAPATASAPTAGAVHACKQPSSNLPLAPASQPFRTPAPCNSLLTPSHLAIMHASTTSTTDSTGTTTSSSACADSPSTFRRFSRRLTGSTGRQDSALTASSTDSRRSKGKVMVFIRSADEVDLQDRTAVEDQVPGRLTTTRPAASKTPPLNIVDMPRSIWRGNKDIYVPAKGEHKHDLRTDGDPQKCRQCEFAATIELDNMGFLFKLKRAMGLVNQIYVFENPFPVIQPVH
ncbi:uncharacterized protein K452DRAFT_356955 [Aplosporella prunicola CBS 121167]|uniref:Uncharacterized protein n=1 Tax=Aplosporella prunicola CBS 121167 TaxID=1176127 RepID=A0A6A6BL59_9PEZI|nr:uncharacterized protein K452DRAFT_356955 [Aplosporella prunicola CBS 121167]KAF2143994.1 hypothetical protein K452DRAFT_356955 [Aplosporella prunicola CBS 121167]